MRTCTVDKWSWFENADLVLVCSRNLACISAAVQTADPYVVVHRSRNYLYPLKITGKNYYVTPGCVGLEEIDF